MNKSEIPGELELAQTDDLLAKLSRRTDSMVCVYVRSGVSKDQDTPQRVHFTTHPGVPMEVSCEVSMDLCINAINLIRNLRDTVRGNK